MANFFRDSARVVEGTRPTGFHARRMLVVDGLKPRRRYTEGRCGEFAQALSLLTGWPMKVLTTINEEGEVTCSPGLHAVVKRPDSQYVDVTGSFTAKALYKGWESWRTHTEHFAVLSWEGNEWPLSEAVVTHAQGYIMTQRPELLHGFPITSN